MAFRSIAVLLAVFAVTSAHAQGAAGANVRSTGDFERRASNAIYRVFPFDREASYLTASRSPETGFAFYGQAPNEFVTINCRQVARFRLVRFANEVGGFSVGECGEERARLEKAAENAPAALRQTFDSLGRAGLRPSEENLRRAGLFYDKRRLPDGSEQHYFPVLAISHGVMPVPTIVVITKDSAWIVQAQVTPLCSQDENHRLCSDTMESLSRIALHLAAPSGEPRPSVSR